MEDINKHQSSTIPNSNSCLETIQSMYSSEEENVTVKDGYKWDITTFNNRSLKYDHSMSLSKDKKNETMRDEYKGDITTFNNFSVCPSKDEDKENEKNKVVALSPSSLSVSRSIKVLDSVQNDLIRKLVLFQEKYESLSKDDLKKVTAFTLGVSKEHFRRRIKHVTELILLNVKRIIDFSQKVSGFDSIDPRDKIILLKGCCTEVMLLWLARKYDLKTDSTTFGNNCRYRREMLRCCGMGDYSDSIFDFCKTLGFLKINSSEYALMTAIVIFSHRGSLLYPKRVIKLREYYTQILKAYVGINRRARNNFLKTLVSNMAILQKLGNKEHQKWFSTKIYYKKPSQVIKKLLDI